MAEETNTTVIKNQMSQHGSTPTKAEDPLQSADVKSSIQTQKVSSLGLERPKTEKRVSFETEITANGSALRSSAPTESKQQLASINGVAGSEVLLGKRTFESVEGNESNEQVSGLFNRAVRFVCKESTGLR